VYDNPILTSKGTAIISIIPETILAERNFQNSDSQTPAFQLLLWNTHILLTKKANKAAHIQDNTFAKQTANENCIPNKSTESIFFPNNNENKPYDNQLTIVVITPQNRYEIISLYWLKKVLLFDIILTFKIEMYPVILTTSDPFH